MRSLLCSPKTKRRPHHERPPIRAALPGYLPASRRRIRRWRPRHQRDYRQGINISLIFDEEEAADRLFCYVDVGPIATANQAAAHHNLLQLNLLTGSKTIGVYGVHPASGNAIFSVHLFNPDAVTGEALARLLSVYADRAIRMRSTLLQNSVNASVEDILMQFHDADEAQSMTDLA